MIPKYSSDTIMIYCYCLIFSVELTTARSLSKGCLNKIMKPSVHATSPITIKHTIK